MKVVELIEKKRNGFSLSKEEINFIVQGYVSGTIPDYQVSALAMAIYFRGMDTQEIVELTLAMAESGDQVDLSSLGEFSVDKHSSGGVGDKTTLIVGPLVAACGLPVAKMSGRGLGHTGGTIDKLSAIPGFQVEMSQDAFISQIKRIGISIISQTGNLVPADKKLYALRDVTATVDSIPLIASSIMSKKIASGAQGMILDVKYGSGAFMSTLKEAEKLAKTMVDIGNNLGRKTIAILSNMDQPLGKAIGNSIEVLEAVECLQGNGPSDLMEVCFELASWMLLIGNKADSIQAAREILEDAIYKGTAWGKFLELVSAQGGDTKIVCKKELPLAPIEVEFNASQEGYIQKIDARLIGISSMILGAGRETKESTLDLGAGIYILRKSGDFIKSGEPVLRLYTSDSEKVQPTMELLNEAVIIGNHPVSVPLMVSTVIQ